MSSLTTQIILSHYGHTAIILLWLAGNLFHIGFQGNYALFVTNPIKALPIAHSLFDPHFNQTASQSTLAFSGIYHILYTLGFTTVSQIHTLSLTISLLAILPLILRTNSPLTFSPTAIGFASIAWAGHLVHLASASSIHSLTFFGGIKSDTLSLYTTDIAHHHLAIGILAVLFTHLLSSINLNLSTLRTALSKSLDLQLALALAFTSYLTSIVAQHTYSLCPFQYLAYNYVTTIALYCHHQYIASFLAIGTLAHLTISAISTQTPYQPLTETAHLSWICLFLGFHTLLLYIHNDTVVAFGIPANQILIEPVFASVIQEASAAIMPISSGDLFVHHAIALGLHTTTLIMLKGALYSNSSHLMPDKLSHGYAFACDGPTRGGTCDISSWDSFYLAFFWLLNTDAWLMFYFHWKHLSLWLHTTPLTQFDDSSTYLNGWFRDYLWFNSAPLVNGYTSDLSVYSWIFLAAHLAWPTGFMFLISWRGYWQELIDIILVMHLKTPILYDLWNGNVYSPIALSIVQARFIGLVHFAIGFIFTYAAFIVGATS
jgi:photosystem I P700 chlorophyll a apoprotein A2